MVSIMLYIVERLLRISLARRSFASSAPSYHPEGSTSQSKDAVPVTALAMRGSNQLSLETPRNNAGAY